MDLSEYIDNYYGTVNALIDNTIPAEDELLRDFLKSKLKPVVEALKDANSFMAFASQFSLNIHSFSSNFGKESDTFREQNSKYPDKKYDLLLRDFMRKLLVVQFNESPDKEYKNFLSNTLRSTLAESLCINDASPELHEFFSKDLEYLAKFQIPNIRNTPINSLADLIPHLKKIIPVVNAPSKWEILQ